ncbi:transcriptional regulator [Yokenella regensburgei]|uniref:transcriptional regulator n=1 Tax=Yokenella regensburgei TaxID=158877 RepID=UPI001432D1C0|nr:YdaS family helix-turn-helix protein [Yokenella regensburgei]QIU89345.1 helix-turn-helix domain-containing protein [Yokenella regensburgei]
MQLNEYLKRQGPKERKALEQHLGISKSYLSQLATGRAAISPSRCIQIEKFTNGQVARSDMRPGDWLSIWPDYSMEHDKRSE